MEKLHFLQLSYNMFSGDIPESIMDLRALQYGPNGIVSMVGIDLSLNYITENIGSMKSLEWLDLSRNNLSRRQLDTLYSGNPSIYEGDSGLCGPPLGRNCTGRNSDESGNEIRSENDSKLFFYFGLGSGFIVGLWVVFCVLLSKKTWRVGLLDQLYVFLAVTWGRVARQGTTD
ncbi:hypothetical protein QOZ80_9BG0711740 [Eleusine coracana subsp. coracana]|nr:hypothetical protein QOZ80_9BG0711680 [Eleusine coracana subsp. coracana]KAK3118978.1 hypothetical protein QOZ80_9BG0711710 [Eleusine coracana subsp. coracana]KAK3118980.1 hypothetical protein QOZ80_9BG0711740 [Eleusine coracana subsp. coracana]